ncbi:MULTISPECIES: MFS transporter [unclassified Rhodococcus (in: high G+C Gram-positive bacteria)]|uniref:MFS transporter n=1 Tax=unclassified Rhodococcus (in: high G+C Gram-positive bacteria) TaxID=192944 RepID=UPI00077B0CF1|nr:MULTISPECIES: MFS transporter [unclassified Rhodococcus (in: high G+C Gram-positive bacteria)]KXX63014.1 MFS transporter [Rhodococcus sp. LB1]PBC58064.1 MFS transporter [Rhodococcus sp. ACPA1]
MSRDRHRSTTSPRPIRLGLGPNLAQFSLLVAVNALVGGMVGQQQTVLPLLASGEFGLTGYTFIFTYVAAFGITKAAANYFAGAWSDRFGRKPVLLVGWLFAIPVPLMLIAAPNWWWVVAANVLLGINQGLTWSTTVVMKIDLVGPARRGLAMGLNEAAGYGAVAVSSLMAGYLADQYGLRPAPFLLGLAYTALALLLSGVFIRETRDHARLEATQHTPRADGMHDHLHADLTNRQIAAATSFTEPALSSASQAGLVNNLNFGLSWGLFPLLFATADLGAGQIGVLFALYPGVWGAGQLVTGALSDRIGRKHLITAGMTLQAAALALIAASHGFTGWAAGTVLLGAGTAMVYPTLLAVIGDVAHPAWRGRAVGIYRVWRDSGYAVGAILGGVVADLMGLHAAVWVAAAVSAASALAVAVRMYETHPKPIRTSTERAPRG